MFFGKKLEQDKGKSQFPGNWEVGVWGFQGKPLWENVLWGSPQDGYPEEACPRQGDPAMQKSYIRFKKLKGQKWNKKGRN